MDTFFVLADSHAQTALHEFAYSARPNAPVLAYVEPRRRVGSFVAAVRNGAHRPTALAARARRSREACAV